jgi:uracil-DNA glycosylase
LTLEKLHRQILVCRKCRLWKDAKHAVPGEGPSNAKVMLIGQNPGEEEDKVGRPFVGRTGKYLDRVLEAHSIDRKRIFITGIVKHKSPHNRAPKPDEIAACLPYLTAQMDLIEPKVVLLMGRVALQTPRREGTVVIETVHPSAAMRFPKTREKFEKEIAALAKRM